MVIKEIKFVVKTLPQTKPQPQVKNLPKELLTPEEGIINSVYKANFTWIPNQRHYKKRKLQNNIPLEYGCKNP